MEIRINPPIDITKVVELYESAGLQRPTGDSQRLSEMFSASNMVLTAEYEGALVGVCRALTDFSYVCYISDLAVHPQWQQQGVASALLKDLEAHLGDQVSLVLLSASGAMAFYPKVGFEAANNCFLRRRRR